MRKDINFLEAYKIYYNDDKRKGLDNYTLLLLYIVTIVILTSGFLHFYSIYVESESVNVFANLEDLKNLTEYDYTVFKKLDYDNFTEYNLMIEEAREKLEALPVVSLKEYNVIKENLYDDMGIISMSFSGDDFSIKMFTSEQAKIPEYVSTIKKEGIFKHVTYDGHVKEVYGFNILNENNDEHINVKYVFTITCILNGGEQNEIE
ncbi:MAG: hypothetical protein PHT02_08925 [Tissierellia bacterium]|nr:hypothetical protein [Tissierellia bacterium]